MSYNKETGMWEGYLYIILNDIYPDKIYVGQTLKTIKDRWYAHRRQIKEHTYTDKLHNAMEKYGVEHFVIEGIEKCVATTKDKLILRLNEKEKYYINKFDSYYSGFNATKGGRDGMEHKMRPVKRFDLYGNFIKEYESIDELKSVFNFNCVSSIYECCMGNVKYAYGSIWRYKEDDLLKYELPNKNEIKEAMVRINSINQIDKYDCYGNLICSYKDATEAALINNVNRKQIMKCCTGRQVYVNTYVYRFACDKFDTYKYYSDKPKLVEKRDLNGNLICIYSSTREAGRSIGLNGSQISVACRGESKQCHGYIWRYVEDPLRNIVPDFNYTKHCKTVYQYDKHTCRLINVYKSEKEASEITGISENTICFVANGKKDVIKTDYVWSFVELTNEEIKSKCRNVKSRKVSSYNKNNTYLQTYENGQIASDLLNLSKNAKTLIWACCRGVAKTAYGYKWYYADDPNQPDKTKIIVQ